MNPHFSIITVCFNEGESIESTCDSIISQTYGNFEWIVIDGGSTDKTLDILKTYDSHIMTLLSEPDDGIYDAMNKGIERARGHYINFMNGGDRFVSHDTLDIVAQAPRNDLLVGDVFIEGEVQNERIAPDTVCREYFQKTTLPHQSSFISRRLFQDYGLYDASYKIVADLEFFARIFDASTPSYFHITEKIAVFDGTGISSTPESRWKKKQEDHRVRRKYFPEYRRSLKCFRQVLRNVIRGVFQ